MKNLLISILLALFTFTASASQPAQVILFGTFHFKDAGLDLVKVEDINVFSEESQAYIEGLTDRLAGFGPNRVLLEYNPESEETMNERYRDYLAGSYELPANEVYQLGFRIAKKAGLERVHSFDHRQIEWQAEAMFEYAKENNSPEMESLNQLLGKYTEEETKARATLDLGELLQRSNDPEKDRMNMGSYLITNSIGAGDGYSGADAAASWWHRNFRMYANIQHHAKPGERSIAIGGSGHMAILKQLIDLDQSLESISVRPFLEEKK